MPKLDALSEVLAETPGACPVHLHMRLPELAWVSLQLQAQVIPEDRLFQSLEELFRRADVARLE